MEPQDRCAVMKTRREICQTSVNGVIIKITSVDKTRNSKSLSLVFTTFVVNTKRKKSLYKITNLTFESKSLAPLIFNYYFSFGLDSF